MTATILAQNLHGLPPGWCIHQPKGQAMSPRVNRRAILAVAAAAAVPAPALALPDPAFAAIAARKATLAAFASRPQRGGCA